jgi:hypothetical protein
MTVEDDQAKQLGWNLEIVIHLKVLSLELPGDNEQNNETHQSG